MKKCLTKPLSLDVAELRDDRSLRPEITGNIDPGLRGYCTGLWGNCTDLRGNCTGLWGNCTDLRGDLDKCEISEEERKLGIKIQDLIMDSNQAKAGK